MRRAARVDGNSDDIVTALRKAGCSVEPRLSRLGKGAPDLLIGVSGRTLIFEVKDGSLPLSARQLTVDEQRWHDEWRGDAYVVNSVDEALAIVGKVRRGEL